jgi:histone arginine demethylase JMJD6
MSTVPTGNAAGGPPVTGPTISLEGIDRRCWDRLDRRAYVREYLNAARPVIVQGASLDRRAYVREYLNAARPVIVQGAIDHWPALGKWTPEFFRTHHGSLEVVAEDRPWKLGELIDRILVSTPGNPAPYLHNQLMAKWPPALSADISPMPECTRPNYLESRLFPSRGALTYIEAYIGGCGAKFPTLHYDGLHTHAFLMQLYGVKEYLVFPPDQARYLYPRSDYPSNTSIPDIENVDLSQFPLFAQAQGSRFQLHPGETLFVPGGWWHTARLLTTAITVSINGVSAVNWPDFRRDYIAQVASYSRLKAALKAPYLAALGVLLSFLGAYE